MHNDINENEFLTWNKETANFQIVKNTNQNNPAPPAITTRPSSSSKAIVHIYLNNGTLELVPANNSTFSLESDGIVIHPGKGKIDEEVLPVVIDHMQDELNVNIKRGNKYHTIKARKE